MTNKLVRINQIGFGLISFGVLYSYITILSASFDLLAEVAAKPPNTQTHTNISAIQQNTNKTNNSNDDVLISSCNAQSTAVTLMMNTIPCGLVKLMYPALFIDLPTKFKIPFSSVLYTVSSLILGTTSKAWTIYLGIILNSIGLGIFDATFISIAPKYHELSFSGYVVGAGCAQVAASVLYAWFRMYMSTQSVMLLLLIMPFIICVSYIFIVEQLDQHESSKLNPLETVKRTKYRSRSRHNSLVDININESLSNSVSSFDNLIEKKLNISQKISLLPSLAKYFFPVFLTYSLLFYSNQGLFELVYFPSVSEYLNQAAQYRWFEVSYMLGELLARTSIMIIRIPYLWLFPGIEFIIMIFFLLHAFQVLLLPSFYLAIFLILILGFMSGGCYVNSISKAMRDFDSDESKGFVASAICNGDTTSAPIAALLSLPTHTAVCDLYKH